MFISSGPLYDDLGNARRHARPWVSGVVSSVCPSGYLPASNALHRRPSDGRLPDIHRLSGSTGVVWNCRCVFTSLAHSAAPAMTTLERQMGGATSLPLALVSMDAAVFASGGSWTTDPPQLLQRVMLMFLASNIC